MPSTAAELTEVAGRLRVVDEGVVSQGVLEVGVVVAMDPVSWHHIPAAQRYSVSSKQIAVQVTV